MAGKPNSNYSKRNTNTPPATPFFIPFSDEEQLINVSFFRSFIEVAVKRTPYLLLPIMSIIVPGLMKGLDTSIKMHQYVRNVWTIEEGLPQNSINSIIQTRNGYIWLGTQNGLARFDGSRFHHYNTDNTEAIRDNWIWKILEDRYGRLWIATNRGGLVLKNGRRFHAPSEFPDLKSKDIRELYEDHDGNIWIGTTEELFTLRTSQGTALPQSKKIDFPALNIRSIFQDRKGRIWVGTRKGLYYRNEKGDFVAAEAPF